MSEHSRRHFLRLGLGGTAAGLLLPVAATVTEASGGLGSYADLIAQETLGQAGSGRPAAANPQPPMNLRATEDNIQGPYYRRGAPYRAKVTPPLEPGTVLLVSGRVWGLDTRRPLANAVIDIWQANAQGRYDNDDSDRPPPANVFVNRARLVTDETGSYEFETIHPGAYRTGPNTWRPPHIHYWVRHPGYRELITQLYFRGDAHQREDEFIRPSLIIGLREQRTRAGTYKTGTFDIVLRAAARR